MQIRVLTGFWASFAAAPLADAGLRARLATAARRLVAERYDWATIGRRFVGLVEETVARRALPAARS